jgi:hypothetical protein
MSVGVMTVGVMSVEEITVGVMTVGVMRRPRFLRVHRFLPPHCSSTRYGWYGSDRTTFFGWYGKPYHNFDRKK